MNPSIKLLIQPGRLDAVERNLASLAEILGATIEPVQLPADCAAGDSSVSELLQAEALVTSAETLAALLRRNSAGLASLDSFASHVRFLMIYGLERCSSRSASLLFGDDSDSAAAAPWPASGQASHYHLPPEGGAVSLHFAGLTFDASRGSANAGAPDAEPGCAMPRARNSASRIIDRDGAPFFAVIRRGNCEIFLLASSEAADIGQPAPRGELPDDSYPELLPWLIFIRRAMGDRCWHNPAPIACLILDDPPLRPRYGFLSFQALAASMRQADFKTTVAFIPWSYSRSAPAIVRLFQQSNTALSLCVHGCDHTRAEFGSTDIGELRRKSRSALERMKLHERGTGLEWDPVMIFPQGVFSSASLLALREEGYLAAVCSGLSSSDQRAANRIADHLWPVSHAYAGAPLFKRHYPRKLLPFALDLFLGKQVLVAEHHTYFRFGYGEAAAFAARLKTMEPRLSWAPLGKTLRSAVQRRVTDSGVELRACTDQISYKHLLEGSEHARLIKPESDPASVLGVRVNGAVADFRLADDRIELEVDGAGECRVEVLRRPSAPFTEIAPRLSYVAKAAMRRYLSELRDDALAGNSRLVPAPIARRILRLRSRGTLA